MQLLTARQIDSVLAVTDSLGLKRLAVIVPLPAADVGSETVMPDGNLLICAPYGALFDTWFAGLHDRLLGMDLSQTPRADQLEPPMLRVPQQAQGSGMRRYWDWHTPPQEALGKEGPATERATEEVPQQRKEPGSTASTLQGDDEGVPESVLADELGGEGSRTGNSAMIEALVKHRTELDPVNAIFLPVAHAVAVSGTILYVSLHGLTWAALGLTVFWALACSVAVTGGYHRLFAHGAYRVHAVVRAFYLFFGAAAVQNSALKWASDHRRHHAYVDEEQDPYNIRKGFWWAHMGWIFRKDALPIANVGDLQSDPLIRLQHRFYIPLATFAGFVLPAAIGALLGDFWGGLLLAGFLRLVLLWHATACVNSVAHSMGAQPYSDRDSSRDSVLTALITMGEGYHNYHHTFPFDYRNGVRAWHFDPTKWLIRVLAWVGLAKDLVRAPEDAIIKARLRIQEKHARERLRANPVATGRLRALREQLENLAEAREALRADWQMLGTRAAAGKRRTMAVLRAEMKHVSRRFREAYATWRSWRRDAASPRGT